MNEPLERIFPADLTKTLRPIEAGTFQATIATDVFWMR